MGKTNNWYLNFSRTGPASTVNVPIRIFLCGWMVRFRKQNLNVKNPFPLLQLVILQEQKGRRANVLFRAIAKQNGKRKYNHKQ